MISRVVVANLAYGGRCALNGRVPHFFGGFALKKDDENVYHGQYDLENNHGV